MGVTVSAGSADDGALILYDVNTCVKLAGVFELAFDDARVRTTVALILRTEALEDCQSNGRRT